MVLSVVRARARAGAAPRRPLRLVFTADEEAGGELGALWLVSEHPELLEGCERGDRRGGRFLADRGRRPAALSDPDRREGHGLAPPDRRRSGRARLVPPRRQRGHRAGRGGGPDRRVRVAAPDHRRPARLPGGGLGGVRDRASIPTAPRRRWPSWAASRGWSAPPCPTRPTRRCCRPATSTTSSPARRPPPSTAGSCPAARTSSSPPSTDLLGDKVRYEVVADHPSVETEFSGALVEAMQTSLVAEDPGARAVPYLMSGGTDAKAWSRLGDPLLRLRPAAAAARPGLRQPVPRHGRAGADRVAGVRRPGSRPVPRPRLSQPTARSCRYPGPQ